MLLVAFIYIYIHFLAMFLSMDKWSYSCLNRFVENTTAVCDMSLYFFAVISAGDAETGLLDSNV